MIMKKQLLFFVMILLPMVAIANSVEINGIYYNLISKTKTAEVISNPNKYTGSVVIPEQVTYEGANYSVTSIGDRSFYECYKLTSVTISNSVKSIGSYAFYQCYRLTSVHISDLEAWCKISFWDANANPLYNAHHLYLNDKEIKDLVIPNSVMTIGQYAFIKCTDLTSITMPNSVTKIGDWAFQSCSGLTSVTIPNSVTSIGERAFNGCTGLITITIPNSVTSIGAYAFDGCSGLTALTIPNGVTRIEGATFRGCSGLTSITIPNSVTSIENGAFAYCYGLTSVTIPNSVTNIGDYAFQSCSSLNSVTIPNSLTSIGAEAFTGCLSLISVTIGSGIGMIGNCVFASCPELSNVFCYAIYVPNTKPNAFNDSYIEYATLHVLAESVGAYKAAEPWKNFKEIVALTDSDPKPDATGINVVRNAEDNKAVIYDLNGVRLSEPQKGINIINGKKYVFANKNRPYE